MGIQGLSKLLSDHAPNSVRQQQIKNYFGRKIAIDASMHIYQFLIVVGRAGESNLTNEAGDTTSHLQGMFFRTIRMLEEGIKPVYVFDGKPPELKINHELAHRAERRAQTEAALAAAKEAQDTEAIEKFSKRSTRVTKQHNEDCKKLLRLMGVPVIDAPSEAEAQCAAMAKGGLVYGVATEDMDCLTFGAPRVIRHMMAAGKDVSIVEFDRAAALEGLGLDDAQFTDMCILCGCDYCPSIKGVGPKTSLTLVQKHGSMEALLQATEGKYEIPDNWQWRGAHDFFRNPDVTPAENIPPLKWGLPDEDGLVKFLCAENGFSEERIRNGVKRILQNREKSTQGRLESFFGPATVKHSANKAAAIKAALDPKKKKGGKLGGFGAKAGGVAKKAAGKPGGK